MPRILKRLLVSRLYTTFVMPAAVCNSLFGLPSSTSPFPPSLPHKRQMRMTDTYIYISSVLPSHPLHRHLRSAPGRRLRTRPPHTAPVQYFQSSLDSLTPLPDNTAYRTHIHTTIRRKIDTNTLLGTPPPSKTLNANNTSHAKTGSTCPCFVVGITLLSPNTCTG